jgi:hypothetical protein
MKRDVLIFLRVFNAFFSISRVILFLLNRKNNANLIQIYDWNTSVRNIVIICLS